MPKYIEQHLQQSRILYSDDVKGADQTACSDVDCGDGKCATSSWEKSFRAALMGAVVASTTTTTASSSNSCASDNFMNIKTGIETDALMNLTSNSLLNTSTESDGQQQAVETNEITLPNSSPTEQGKIGRPCSDCGFLFVVLTFVQSRNNHKRLVCTKCRRRL